MAAKVADILISRFRVEQIEGGVVVAGRVFPSYSSSSSVYSGLKRRHHLAILILLFACVFLAIGIVLTVLAYRPLVLPHHHLRLIVLTGSQVAGPLLLVVGLLFLAAGLAVKLVASRLDHNAATLDARHDDRGFRNKPQHFIRRNPSPSGGGGGGRKESPSADVASFPYYFTDTDL